VQEKELNLLLFVDYLVMWMLPFWMMENGVATTSTSVIVGTWKPCK
jgi:hypothetical protein